MDSGASLIFLARGEYQAGDLALRSNVTLELAAGATLNGQISIENAANVAIWGHDRSTSRIRGTVTIRGSHGIRFRNFDQEGPNGQGYFDSSDIAITGVNIRQRLQHHGSGSAIWFSNCKDVTVADCDFRSNDDVFALKHSAENVHLKNSILTGRLAAAFKMGTESEGLFHNISMTDCSIPLSDRGAISIESVDGARIDGVSIANIRMADVASPLFIRLGARARYGKGPGSIRNIHIHNIEAFGVNRDEGIGSAISGLPGHPIEDLSISRVRVTYRGGGTVADAHRKVSEFPAAYPEFDMFGRLPAYGFFIRHARRVTLRDVSLAYSQVDARPPLHTEDVQGLMLERFQGMTQTGTPVHFVADTPPSPPAGPAVRPGAVWVDSNGNGKFDPGEQSFAGIAAALAAAQAGDCIVLGEGDHKVALAELPLRIRSPRVHIRAAGNREKTSVSVEGADFDQGKSHSLFLITADDVSIEGLTLRGGAYDVFVDGSARTAVLNCFFDGSKRNNIKLNRARAARITANRFRGSGTASVDMIASRDCVIEDNLFYEDTAGIEAADSSVNRFTRNTFRDPAWFGLCLVNSHGNTVEGNLVDGSRLSGVQLRGSNDNRVTGNFLTNNKTEGLLIDGDSRNNTIRENDIHGNKGQGIANESPAPVNAAENWWGSAAGPQGTVSGKVISRPWLLEARRGVSPGVFQN